MPRRLRGKVHMYRTASGAGPGLGLSPVAGDLACG